MEHLQKQVLVALLHLCGTHGPTVEEIGFESILTLPIALRNFDALELKLFP